MCGTATRDQSRPLFRVAYSATHWESPQGSPAASHPTAAESQDALRAIERVGSGCGTYCLTAGLGDVPWDPLGAGGGCPAVDPVDPELQPETASSAVKAAAATDLATDRVIDPPPRRPPLIDVNARIQVARANRESLAPRRLRYRPDHDTRYDAACRGREVAEVAGFASARRTAE